MVSEFLKYCGSDIRNQLKIMNLIFEKGGVPSNLRKTLIKPLCKKGYKSECGNFRGISLVSVGSKLLSNDTVYTERCCRQGFKRRTVRLWKRQRMCQPIFYS